MTVPRGFTRCDECEGEGKELDEASAKALARAVGFGGPEELDNGPCPSCGGSGLVPTEKLREEAARAIAAFHRPSRPDFEFETFEDVYRREADAVLRKVAEHIREER